MSKGYRKVSKQVLQVILCPFGGFYCYEGMDMHFYLTQETMPEEFDRKKHE
jgi:hypothetical protein